MKRIALLAPASSIHTQRWAASLADQFEIHVITMHSAPSDPGAKFETHLLPWSAPFGYIGNRSALKRILKFLKPDLLHIHYASGYGALGQMLEFRPKIQSVWGSDVFRFPLRSKFHKLLVGRALSQAEVVTSTSEAMANQVVSLYPDIQRPLVIPFGIDVERFSQRDRQKRESLVVGTVKALAPVYGIDLLIKAFALVIKKAEKTNFPLVRQLQLEIVGVGPQELELRNLASTLGIESLVNFVGFVPNEKVPERLRAFDIYVAASRSESFGVAVLEASACGVPVVVTRVGGLPEIVVNGQTGIIVEPEAVGPLADAIWDLALDENKRKSLGDSGASFVRKNYSWDDCVFRMKSLYDSILEKYGEVEK
jgi:glycosyltransferase involved in cell wall biosynthesis